MQATLERQQQYDYRCFRRPAERQALIDMIMERADVYAKGPRNVAHRVNDVLEEHDMPVLTPAEFAAIDETVGV